MVKVIKIKTELPGEEIIGLVLKDEDLEAGIKDSEDIAIFSPKEIKDLKGEKNHILQWIVEAKKIFRGKIEFKEEKNLAHKRKQLISQKRKQIRQQLRKTCVTN